MVKAVIFDLGGVLVDNPAPGMFKHYSEHINVPLEEFANVYSKFETEWQKGKLSENEFWENMTSELHATKPQVESLWLDGFLTAYKEKNEMFELIKSLKQKNYKVALLSNTEVPVMNHIKKLSWPDFDLFVYSCEVGMRKPNADIYEHTLKTLEVAADEAVFIDDKEENIEAAEKLGIHGIVFQHPQQVKEKLQKAGVEF